MAVKCSSRTLWTTADQDGYPYWVEFEDRPFAKGNSKFMYKGRLNGKGPRSGDYCTIKVFRTIDIAQQSDWDQYISRTETANKLASQFNKLIDSQYKVKFLVPMTALVDISSTCTDCIYFMSNTKRIRSDDCVAVESYIGRKFRKFYRNSPLKGAEYAYILQAFSHFTASQTGDTLICGLQGVARGTEFILTNPIIHSANQEWGPKDQGPQGFRKFFSAHTCNDVCHSLDLPAYLETMSVTDEIDKDIAEVETCEKVQEAPIVAEEASQVTEIEAETVPKPLEETPEILQTPPMSRSGRTILAPVSVEVSASRTSSVTGPPEFVEDIPGENLSRPSVESMILDATPIDDIAPQLSSSQEVLPPPSSEYTPCKTVEEYLELKRNCAPFSPGSEAIPLIDDELACAESEKMEVLPPPTDDFEPTISPSLSSYMKDKESLEIVDPDSEIRPVSISEDQVFAADPVTPRESVTQEAEVYESLANTPGTISQDSLVTTPCGSIPQELDSQASVDLTPKGSVSQDAVPVAEPPIEADLHLDLQEGHEVPHDIESQVCLVSIPPDCMDHHLDTLESLEALSPVSEKLTSVEFGQGVEASAEDGVFEEPVSVQELSETPTTQDASTESMETDNVEVEVHKPECEETMSSDFKQSLETIPEGSTESDSAHSLENENLAPEVPTEVEEAEHVAAEDGTVVEDQAVQMTDASGQEETSTEAVCSQEVPVEPATEVPAEGEATISQETAVETSAEPSGEATVAEETAVETSGEPSGEATVSQETAVETCAEPAGEATVSQETAVEASAEPAGEATVAEETAVEASAEPVEEATIAQETAVEASAEPSGEAPVAEETAVETSVEPSGEATVAEEAAVETSAEPSGEAAVAEEAAVETSAEPAGEAAVAEEAAVETSAEPAGEAAVAEEAAVETSAEPAGEAVNAEETAVETSVEPTGEATIAEETAVETSAEPSGEANVAEETAVETSVEPSGEATVAEEAAVETSADPAGEAAVAEETAVETSAEPSGEANVAEETAVETSAEPSGETAVSQETAVEASAEPAGEATISQETAAEPSCEAEVPVDTTPEPVAEATVSQETTDEPSGEAAVAQETSVETKVGNVEEPAMGTRVESTDDSAGECRPSVSVMEPTSMQEADVSDAAVLGVSSEDLVVESADEMPGENYGSQNPDRHDYGPTGEGYTSQGNEFESADGYSSQDSGFGYSNQDQGFNSDPSSNDYSRPYTPVTSSHPTKAINSIAINTITSHVPDPYFYGVPPEYRISEGCDSSRCEPDCPQRFTKMTIVPDLDTMEYVETKCLDPVYDDQDNQQGVETLPRRRVSYYLEPQESHEIITFRINISPELTRPESDSHCQDSGIDRQYSNQSRTSVSSVNYCPNCQPREISEHVGETSGQCSDGSSNIYSYHYTDASDCTESMPQRSCGYSTEVQQNMPSDWSPTHSNWDDGQCTTGLNIPRSAGQIIDSKFGPSI